MTDDISTSDEASKAFKETVNGLMSGLKPIVTRNDKDGFKMPDFKSLLSTAKNTSSITTLFDQGLTPTQKFLFAQAWAINMDEKVVIKRFIKDTKKVWKRMESKNEGEQEKAVLDIVEGMDIPGNGAKFLHALYEKKDLLTQKEKKGVLEYFKTCIYYANMYEELKTEGK